MEFQDHKPIYLQIADSLCDKILAGDWKEEERIPSVRELGAQIGVNPNTIIRTYDHLQNDGIIFNKRGIGYFVSPEAKKLVSSSEKENFIKNELPTLFKKMEQLSINIEEVVNLYKKSVTTL